jgi:hypothetical protein
MKRVSDEVRFLTGKIVPIIQRIPPGDNYPQDSESRYPPALTPHGEPSLQGDRDGFNPAHPGGILQAAISGIYPEAWVRPHVTAGAKP